MGKPMGFIEYGREDAGYRDAGQRVLDWREVGLPLTPEAIHRQAARCMDCGIPFCHGAGCPLSNRIPEFNELIHLGRWQEACANLHSTNNFPEITGRVCPAPCETACTLGVNDKPVTIRQIELQITERGFEEGWIVPIKPTLRSGKRVAVVGSGPAGLAAAQQLARMGHDVTVFEKDARPGGMLRYGIPDFKLEKAVLDRRMRQLAAEGVEFQPGVKVGEDISIRYLRKRFDCVCLAMGAGSPRDLQVQGRGYENILFAMDFLSMQNRLCSGEPQEDGRQISARDRNVVVIGGGDTGSDCVGTAIRQGARSVTQIEILPQPPQQRPDDTPWPMWPRIMRTSSSHQEGCTRRWGIMTKSFSGSEVRVSAVNAAQVEWFQDGGQWKLKEIPGSEFTMKADLVLLALGFVHVAHEGLVGGLDLKLDERGNIAVKDFQTSQPWVFAAGDAAIGASLVVRAIDQGRGAADAIDAWLMRQ